MKKRIISLTLAAVMGMSLLAGCGGTKTETKESEVAKVESTKTSESTAAKESEEAKPAETENIVVYYYSGNDWTAAESVIGAMNEYSEEKIGVTITFKPIASGEYTDTVSRVLAVKEEADIVWADTNRVINWSRDGALMEISELLPNYPELLAVAPQRIWDSVELTNGKFFIPNYKETGTGYSIVAPKAIVDAVKDKTGIDWNTIEMESIWDIGNFEEYLLAAMDVGVDMPIPDGSMVVTWLQKADPKYEATTMPFVVDKEAGKVYNVLEVPELKEYIALMNEWKDKGIWKEEMVMSDYQYKPYCKSGSYAMMGYITVPDCANNVKNTYGIDCYVKEVTDNIITSNSALGSGWTIAAYSKKADACMKWLQLLNTDTTFADMWVYGVEGTNFTREANGSITKIADTGWGNSAWKATNTWVLSLQSSEAADKKEQYTAFNESAVASPILGFRADFSKVSAELAAVTEAYSSQRQMLSYGFIDEAGLDDLIAQTNKAGADKIVAELQAQLDAFLAK